MIGDVYYVISEVEKSYEQGNRVKETHYSRYDIG